MHHLNPLFAVALLILTIGCVRATFIWAKSGEQPGRFSTIDGLRGYLAFFVFLHHAAIWFTYSRTGEWTVPDSHLYTHLGESSVALFFMITSFLFYDKLLDSKSKLFEWRSFFISRFFRLTPLYFVVMIFLFLIVAILSDGTLIDTPRYIFFCAVRWLLFTVPGSPAINHIDTARIVAGVTWSLPYEWCFYLVLPLIALTTGQRPHWVMLAVAGIGLAMAWLTAMRPQFAFIFLGGMIAARLVRNENFLRFAKSPVASIIVLACFSTVLMFPTAYDFFPSLILTLAFSLIAGGADLFGSLNASTSRRLGELAYSIYLTHGILLFSMANFVIGKGKISSLSSTTYWMYVAVLVPCLLTLSAVTFHIIEKPGIKMGKKLGKRWPAKRILRVPFLSSKTRE
ncbi:acyltransferase family protein [Massilia sp. S19_KUP03_FR1]|uniref:acyltransferase family protein n=1 Tax=Massilia sp. S19_KUP03_FR1 TaxID=3025503 RepID=UPI002FCD9C5F